MQHRLGAVGAVRAFVAADAGVCGGGWKVDVAQFADRAEGKHDGEERTLRYYSRALP